ncbi:MAG: hypothetical protein Q8K26_04635, partial [Candidatus Gracilibacteria bacterium]|nr:hypothetical protein [Candidatus Gracilibacteria bacterium]
METWKGGVKVEPTVAPPEADTPPAAATTPAVDTPAAIKPVKGASGLGQKGKNEGTKETKKQKKKPEESHLMEGIKVVDTLVGLTGKITGTHVNLRKENGDKTGETVSNTVSVNLTGRTGKRNISGKDIEYYEVVLPGENTTYFVAKKYVEVGTKQIKPDVPARLTGSGRQESLELSKKDQLSKENQDLLNANKSVEVGTYTITQGKVVGQDWGSDESGIKKTDEQLKKAGRETFSGKIELVKKDGKYILEMSRTGVFGLGNYTYSEGLTDKIPTKQQLEEAMGKMRDAKQKDGLDNYAVT